MPATRPRTSRFALRKIRWPGTHSVAATAVAILSVSVTVVRCGLLAAEPEPSLLAHWPFDDPAGPPFADTGPGAHHAVSRLVPSSGSPFQVVPGLFGAAVQLEGSHHLRAEGELSFAGLTRMAVAAWCRPSRFERYNEILRKEDGDQRVLFSFQEHGTVLSLGLNAGGYFECDARLEPGEVLDGRWHHCAATFDGTEMRVYFDGGCIGAAIRPGPLVAGGPAPVCLGSMNGSECFQGTLDDLRLCSDALSDAQVAALYDRARPTLDRLARELEGRVAATFVAQPIFARTLTATRARVAEAGAPLDRELAAALGRRLKAQHPRECADFERVTGLTPGTLIAAADTAAVARETARLVELMIEYKPLTPQQWHRQTAQSRERWAKIGVLEQRFATLAAQGAAANHSPAWIDLMLDVSAQTELRPMLEEAVAPYVQPNTPAPHASTAAEVRAALEDDWLFQADGQPTPERIRQEIAWARELDGRFGLVSADRAALSELEVQAQAATAPDTALYFRVRELKRRILFRNPVLDFSGILLVDMPFPQGSEWQHETRHRLGYMAVPGARLMILEGLSADAPARQLMPQAPLHGSFWRPDLSWDGRRVLFCFKPHNEKSFHLYEIGVDGSGLRQITDGAYDDLDPVYLPDNRHIVFSTTRGNTYVRCMPPTSAFVLARCDLDGSNLYLISANNEPDYLPSVLGDGRLVYTRWEYTDKPLWRAQKLWTAHPDGTQVNTLWGNQSVWPDLIKDARAIPGSHRVMFTGSAHHDWFSGSVGIIDPDAGLNFPEGLTKVTADVAWPECGNGPVDPVESLRYHRSGNFTAYYSPYPLTERDFLVSANREGKFRLYLMDTDGNRELVYEGAHHIFHAQPLRSRPVPPVLPDTVAWPVAGQPVAPRAGVLYSRDVYEGAPPALRGHARYLRVLSIDHKTYTYWHKRPYISTGPVVSGVQSDGVKRILGTVPIEPDGSVMFEAPAGIPLHFQLLDGEQRALHTMRSFANLMPGEHRGCLGCHERHNRAPGADARYAVPPPLRRITPPPWSDTTVSYPRYVRPVLDKYCVQCHAGDGEGRKTLDLSPRPGFLEFDEPYWTLIGRPTWGQPYTAPQPPPPGWGIADMLMVEAFGTTDPQGYRTPAPMTGLSCRSRLINLASSGKHHDVRVAPTDLLRLVLWVDALCPYRGEEEIRAIPDPEFQGIDWLAVRPRIRTAPEIARPGPLN